MDSMASLMVERNVARHDDCEVEGPLKRPYGLANIAPEEWAEATIVGSKLWAAQAASPAASLDAKYRRLEPP